ncbi:hypothetical protein Q0601_15105 [Paracoccus onubensis]|uniref:hypothetical protein n=1 Tax=Paracoccus onubensis TaxID=1675788 RepID=UPI0027318651|nr:hypothetical protein [Paracoccus onubensis]MDP0928513.1 hypothetical protein [Paracoccus onubensis]
MTSPSVWTGFGRGSSVGDYIDGEYGPGDSDISKTVEQIEDEGQSEPEAEAKEPEPAPKKEAEKPKRSTARAPDHTDKTPHHDRPTRQSKAQKDDEGQSSMFGGFSVSEMIQKIADLIKNDLTDGAPLDETLEMYEVQLADIRSAEPDEYEGMIDEFKAFVAERDGEGGE